MISSTTSEHTWTDEARDLLRGVGGAALLGIPLVYTMELWQFATMIATRVLFLYLLAALIAGVGYNFVSGFRHETGLKQAVYDSFEALGIGILLALLLLFLLNIVGAGTPITDIACKTAVVAIPLSLGVSVANKQFSGGGQDSDDEGQASAEQPASKISPDLYEAGIALAGSLLFAFNIPPTEEVMLIASRTTPLHLIGLVLFSLFLSYGLLFVAAFEGREERRKAEGLLQTPLGETLLAYLIALAVSFVLIVTFHAVTPQASLQTTIAATIVLGLPATIGGAAGRLLA